jgi:hypothetical protein
MASELPVEWCDFEEAWPMADIYERVDIGDCLTIRLSLLDTYADAGEFVYADDLSKGFDWPWGGVLCTA